MANAIKPLSQEQMASAYLGLETPICELRHMAKIAHEIAMDQEATPALNAEQNERLDRLCFVVTQTSQRAGALYQQFCAATPRAKA